MFCPGCGSKRFYFVQDVTEYHLISSISLNCGVELACLHDAVPSNDGYKLWCEDCNKEFTEEECIQE